MRPNPFIFLTTLCVSLGSLAYDLSAQDSKPAFQPILLADSAAPNDWNSGSGAYLVAFSPDGKVLLSFHNNARIYHWDLSNGKLTKSVHLGNNSTSSPLLTLNSRILVFQTWRQIEIRGCFPDCLLKTIPIREDSGSPTALANDGRAIATSNGWGDIGTVNCVTGENAMLFRTKIRDRALLSFSNDKQLLFAATPKSIEVFDLKASKKVLHGIDVGPDREVCSINQTSDGKSVVIGCEVRGRDEDIVKLGFPPDAKGALRVFTVLGGEFQVWDQSLSKPVARKQAHSNGILRIALSPTKTFFATASFDGSIALWRATDYEQLGFFHLNKEMLEHLAISQDGRKIAACYRDGKILVWNTGVGQ